MKTALSYSWRREGRGGAGVALAVAVITVNCDPCQTANRGLAPWITSPASTSPGKPGGMGLSKQLLILSFPNTFSFSSELKKTKGKRKFP